MNEKNPNYTIKVLDKTLLVLEVLLKNEFPMRISEISKILKLYPSTVHRILSTLKYWGYVESDLKSQKYSLGIKLIELGMAKLQRVDFVNEAIPYLKELVKLCNETVHLGVLVDKEVVYLAKEEPSQTIRMISNIGRRAPIHCTALGKVLLAYMPEEDTKQILNEIELNKYTDNTITDKEQFQEELNKIKEQGYAQDREEHEKNVCCLAAAVKNHQGKVIAALSISSPSFRMNPNVQKSQLSALSKISKELSKKLGYKGN